MNISGNANQNGSLNRTPSSAYLANPREGAKLLTTATLKADLTSSATGAVEIEGLIGSGLDDSRHTIENLHIKIGSEKKYIKIVLEKDNHIWLLDEQGSLSKFKIICW